jgi:hypothetical protein
MGSRLTAKQLLEDTNTIKENKKKLHQMLVRRSVYKYRQIDK